ncbi:MAG: hypothetical protein ACI9MR_001008 [Myxococcota bacterium]
MRYDQVRGRPFFFVGRDEALAQLRNELRWCGGGRVGYVAGPEAVGKTTLLREFGRWVASQNMPFTWLDCRPHSGLNDASLPSLFDALPVPRSTTSVLVLDHVEALDHCEATLAQLVRARLGPKTLLLLTGRRPQLGRSWEALTACPRFFEVHPGPLHIHEALTYLRRRDVAGALGLQLACQSFGHPLPLALVGDIAGFGQPLAIDPTVEGMALVGALAPQFLAAPLASDARLALMTACLVPCVDAPMLRRALARLSVHGVHRALAGYAVAEVNRDTVRFPALLREAALAHLVRHGDPLLGPLLERLSAHIEVDVLVHLSHRHRIAQSA